MEIHRAGRRTPIGHSDVYFETATEAKQAGQKALDLLLSEFSSISPHRISVINIRDWIRTLAYLLS